MSSLPRSSRRPGRVLGVCLAVILIIVIAWLVRVPLLQGAARAWIVTDEPLTPADAVIVLGGGVETRPFAAAEYYRTGLAPRVLVSDVRLSRSEKLGMPERWAGPPQTR